MSATSTPSGAGHPPTPAALRGERPQTPAPLRPSPLALVALLAWRGWLPLPLSAPGRDVPRLLDAEPVLSGRHPLHLYHGYLGAGAFHDRGSLSCFDPAFHAGYPKTPVF